MAYIYDLIDAWNNAGTTFTAIKMNVTDTASAAGSKLIDLLVGSSTRFNVSKSGNVTFGIDRQQLGFTYISGSYGSTEWALWADTDSGTTRVLGIYLGGISLKGTDSLSWTDRNNSVNIIRDLFLSRDAAGVLAQRNSTNPQTYRLYGTYTDASNYERGYLTADSNGFTLGTEALGTGTKRPVRIVGPSLASAEAVSTLDILQTWNTTGTPTAFKLNVTDTASNASSLLIDLQVGSVSQFRVDKAGRTFSSSYRGTGAGNPIVNLFSDSSIQMGNSASAGAIGYFDTNVWGVKSTSQIGWGSSSITNNGTIDTILSRRGIANLRFGAADTSTVLSTVTITIASPGVVTWSSHSMSTGTPVQLTTTGALPTGITASTIYYAIVVDNNTFKLATTFANSLLGTAINTSGSQSGTHTGLRAAIDQTLSVQSVAAGVTNFPGADFTITGSQGTGTGVGGSIIFQVAPAGNSGTNQNPLVDALTIGSDRTSLFQNSIRIARNTGGETFSVSNEFWVGGGVGPVISKTFAGALKWGDISGNSVFNIDLAIFRDDANILAQRNSTNAQTFRLYNTFTDASNYERGFMRWSTNILQIGVENAGTGTARQLEFFVGGATRFTITTAGTAVFESAVIAGGDVRAGATAYIWWNNRTRMSSPADGVLTIGNSSQTDFNRLQFGGTTSAFPALKRSGAALQVRLADDSADAAISASTFTASNSTVNTSAISSTGYSLTGSSSVPAVDIAGTWNTTGAPTGIKLNITDVASSTSSLLMDLQTNGNSRFKVAKDGSIEAKTISTSTSAINTSAISSTGHSLTGSSAVSMVDLAGTWNTSGTPTAFKMNVTDTASNAASLLMDLQVGGNSRFKVTKNGGIVATGTVTAPNISSLTSIVAPMLGAL